MQNIQSQPVSGPSLFPPYTSPPSFTNSFTMSIVLHKFLHQSQRVAILDCIFSIRRDIIFSSGATEGAMESASVRFLPLILRITL